MVNKLNPMKRTKVSALFIDDEMFHSRRYIDALVDCNISVTFADTPQRAVECVSRSHFDVVILDVMMDPQGFFTHAETKAGETTGIALARRIRRLAPKTVIAALTNNADEEVRSWFLAQSRMYYFAKQSSRESCTSFAKSIATLASDSPPSPKVFIVHGRDMRFLANAKRFFSSALNIKDLTVLAEAPSKGRTIIEKFEDLTESVDIVVVLLTPDDIGGLKSGRGAGHRARQNVIFELGYFYGRLSRRSGRVLLIYRGHLELPSDLAGVVYIDASRGMRFARTEIEQELGSWRPGSAR